MVKTMAIFKVVMLALVFVPLVNSLTVEEELAQLREIVSALQDRFMLMEERLTAVGSVVKQNDTEDLEARVTILEESVADLEVDVVDIMDDIEDAESVNVLQDERINTLGAEIFDNENDIEALVSTVDTLEDTTLALEDEVAVLDQRVGDLESGGGGNNTDLTERVETLEEVTSQLSTNVSDLMSENAQQDEMISGIEDDIAGLDQRVENLESGSGNVTERVEALEEVTSQMNGDISELQATTEDFESRITELETTIQEPWEACLSSPCENAGTCVDVNVDTFICMCADGYFGLTCADSFDDAIFLASLDSTVTGLVNPIIFDDDVINPGGHYSTTTGKYTAPYDGIYQFFIHTQTREIAKIEVYLDDSLTGSHNDELNFNVYFRSTTFLLELTAGQTVHVSTGNSNGGADGTASSLLSYFGGYLLKAN